MLWVAGHVVQTRAMVLQLLGEPVDTGWGQLFDRGAPAPTFGEVHRYPSRKDIDRQMRDIGPRLRAKLASLSDEYLAGPARMQIPGTNTVADELAFFCAPRFLSCRPTGLHSQRARLSEACGLRATSDAHDNS
jgi:hypothetical protein